MRFINNLLSGASKEIIWLFILPCFLLTAKFSFTQTFCNAVGGTGDDYVSDMVSTNGGGYIIAGYTNSYGAGGFDAYIVKFDIAGAIQWTRTVGGTMNDYAYAITRSSDGGYVFAGKTMSYGAGLYDNYIVKLDSIGNIEWTKTVGGFSFLEYSYSIIATNDGGYAVAGATDSYGAGNTDCYIIKLDSIGNVEWAETVGGIWPEEGWAISQTNDGGYFIAGFEMSYGAGNSDCYIMKLNSTGVLIWTMTVGGGSSDVARAMTQTNDGGCIAVGYTSSYGVGGLDFYMVKLDSLGVVEWTRTVGGTELDIATAVAQTSDGGYVVSGFTESFGAGDRDFYIVKLNATGVVEWTKTMGGPCTDVSHSIVETNDGGYVIGGYTDSYGLGSTDVYIVKLDASGNSCCLTGNGGGIADSGGISASGGMTASGGSFGSGGISGSGGILTNGCLLSASFSATNNNTVCVGSCAKFSDLSTGGATSWTWSFSGTDSATSSMQNPARICYNSIGSFDVQLIISNGCSTDTLLMPDFIKVVSHPTVIANASDTTISCQGDTVLLTGSGALLYAWDNGVIDGLPFVPLITSTYSLIGIDGNNCVGRDTITITVDSNPSPKVSIIITNDSCDKYQGSIITKYLRGTPPLTYSWNTNDTLSNILNLNQGIYTLTITDSFNCDTIYNISINNNDNNCPTFIELPNAFSPNNDGENDIFYIKGAGVEQIEIRIYDRWGSQVFNGTTINSSLEGWDGQFKGRYSPNGVYVYLITGFYDDGSIIKQTGNITVIR